MFIALSIIFIIINLVFIYFATQNHSKYGTPKLILALVSIIMWVISMIIVYVGLDGEHSSRLVYLSHTFEAFVAPVSAVALYEYANMKKVKPSTFFIVCLIPLFAAILSYLPMFNQYSMYHIEDAPKNIIGSYRYTNLFLVYEAYSYLSGVVCIYWFHVIEKKAHGNNRKKIFFVFTPIVVGTLVNFSTIHGILPVKINYAPIIYAMSYFTLLYLLTIYNFTIYRNIVINNIVDKSGTLVLAIDKKANFIFANKELLDVFKISNNLIGKSVLDRDYFLRLFPLDFYENIISKLDFLNVDNNKKADKLGSDSKVYPVSATMINENTISDNLEYSLNVKNKKYKMISSSATISKKEIIIIKLVDITVEIERSEVIKNISYYDWLTKLKNRMAFEKEISDYDNMENIALISLDIDNLKTTNDILGQNAGDLLLINFSNLLTKTFKDNAINIYRLGGDEFCVICKVDTMEKLTLQINTLFKEANYNNEDSIHLNFSLGYSIKTKDTTALDLYRYSDASMYKSKENGKNQATLFDQTIYDGMILYDKLKEDFIRGLMDDEMVVYFQGKYDLNKKIVNGAEALVRWNHKELGIVSPFKFLGIASTLKLLSEIDFIMLEKSCEIQSKWKRKYGVELEISVNMSLDSLIKPSLFHDVSAIIKKYNVSPNSLTLEVLESKLISDFEFVQEVIKKLTKIGVNFSIDDFGSGYSNFDTINILDAKYIKLDKSLVDNIAINDEARENVTAICKLIKNLDCEIVAEGVETYEQYKVLEDLKIDIIQGYYFSKPLCLDDFEDKFLKDVDLSNF